MLKSFLSLIYFLIIISFSYSQEVLDEISTFVAAPIGWTNEPIFNGKEILKKYGIVYHTIFENNCVISGSAGKVENIIINNDGKKSIEIVCNFGVRIVYSGLTTVYVNRYSHIKKGDMIGLIEIEGKIIRPIYIVMNNDLFNNLGNYTESSFKSEISTMSPVYALLNGRVDAIGYDKEYGHGLYIDVINKNIKVQYRYLGAFCVDQDKQITMGKLIAYTGYTGDIKNPSFEMEIESIYNDTLYYLTYVVIKERTFK
jgi:hypothetical protein